MNTILFRMQRTRFERKRYTSRYWYNKASDLMGSAATIHFATSSQAVSSEIVLAARLDEGFDLSVATFRVFDMLCGMALELVYKAIIVENGNELPMSHDLLTLAEHAGIRINKDDETLLLIWSQCVIWDGKYPVPKNEKVLNEYNELIESALFDPIEGTRIKRLNNRIGWPGFKSFWDIANDKYWSICEHNKTRR